jgi:hypothetical protein
MERLRAALHLSNSASDEVFLMEAVERLEQYDLWGMPIVRDGETEDSRRRGSSALASI